MPSQETLDWTVQCLAFESHRVGPRKSATNPVNDVSMSVAQVRRLATAPHGLGLFALVASIREAGNMARRGKSQELIDVAVDGKGMGNPYLKPQHNWGRWENDKGVSRMQQTEATAVGLR